MRSALVTGCSSGIGKAVAQALLGSGWTVYGLSRTDPGIYHDHFTRLYADLFLPTDIDLVGAWLTRKGLDAVIHCAAQQGPTGPLRDSEPREWHTCLQVNLTGTYELVRATLPALETRARETGDARLLLFSGGGAFSPRPNYSAYAVSKAGVVALMEALAAELGDSGVTANCVAPGYVPTAMHDLPDAPSVELERAVACVLHLLSAQTRGLNGRTISAEWDRWSQITPASVPHINASKMGTRDRNKVYEVDEDGGIFMSIGANEYWGEQGEVA